MIITAFLRALGQLGDARFRRVLLLGVGLTIGLLVAITWGLSFVLGLFLPDSISLPWVGQITWVDDVASWAFIGTMFVASIFLMVPVASAFTSMFLEDIADAVEDRHYPQLTKVPNTPFMEALRDTISFLVVIVVANVASLVVYFGAPPLAPFVFWGLNGFLLGREYFQVTAMRRLGRKGAGEMRQKHILTIWAAGTLMVIPLTIPLVNLLVPVLGAATFTHIYHSLEARS